jgi:hypothetical protein
MPPILSTGNTNITVIAYTADLYAILKEQLSAERLNEFYHGVVNGQVGRHVDKIGALNFVAHDALVAARRWN